MLLAAWFGIWFALCYLFDLFVLFVVCLFCYYALVFCCLTLVVCFVLFGVNV